MPVDQLQVPQYVLIGFPHCSNFIAPDSYGPLVFFFFRSTGYYLYYRLPSPSRDIISPMITVVADPFSFYSGATIPFAAVRQVLDLIRRATVCLRAKRYFRITEESVFGHALLTC
jgi:hypothetical protein